MMDESGPPPDTPEYTGDQPDQPSQPDEKASQQEANYREGNPQRSCGLCGHFDSKGHSCDVVEGDISPFGFSDRYLRQDNPFRTGEKEGFKGGTKVAAPRTWPRHLPGCCRLAAKRMAVQRENTCARPRVARGQYRGRACRGSQTHDRHPHSM